MKFEILRSFLGVFSGTIEERLKLVPSMTKVKKTQFSKFSKSKAFELLGLTDLLPWQIDDEAIVLGAFFQERLARLKRNFDLESYEESKKLLIDALCDEALNPVEHLKIWKGAQLEGEVAAGYVDYLVAERKRYLTAPLLCIIEAKKDDFEQGLAQCLVEMDACRWQNEQQGQLRIDIFGIVTNGEGWQFYRMKPNRETYETPLYSIGDLGLLLGRLQQFFLWCEQQLCYPTESFIIRTGRGLAITGTRVTLYDVMDYVTEQYPSKFIRAMLGLTDEQVDAALSYIDAHRAEVEAEYYTVLQEAEELRQYYEEQNRDLIAHIAAKPPRAGTEAIREKLRAERAKLELPV